MHCPICSSNTTRRNGTPYFACDTCGCWHQSPLPPKTFHGPEEPPISDDERAVNRWLAASLFANVMRGERGPTLDIGSKVPVLASAFAELGCEATAMEPFAAETFPNVRLLRDDFEAHKPSERFRLITLIHVLEHLYDPVEALRKLRRMVTEDGRIFIRIPDHTVPGYERDLTAHHYTIHPFFHCLSDVCEMLVRLGNAFTVEGHDIPGPGQRDIVLRPITKAPTLGVGMIVRNEERDLPRCLRSIASIADGVVIIDTGSTDRTLTVAHNTINQPVWSRTYLRASEQDADGEWRITNFAKARNEYVHELRERGFTHTLSMDADDELIAPHVIRQAMYLPRAVVGVWMDLGDNWRQVHHRLWPADWYVHYKGWCHEFPVIDGLPSIILDHECIRHDATPHGNETSNERNLRILLRQFEAEPDARTAFYIANTHKDGGRHALAIDWYRKRLAYGAEFRDEYLFAMLYLGRSQADAGDLAGGLATMREGLALAPDWQEFRMDRAVVRYKQGRYHEAIAEAVQAINAPIPITILWRERGAYRDQPLRLISWCHEHLGDLDMALLYSRRASALLRGDADWQAREKSLEQRVTTTKQRIALVRPGAIGDVLMTLNLVPLLCEKYPDAKVHYYTSPDIGCGLLPVMAAAGVTAVRDCAGLVPADYDHVISLVGYPLNAGYPYKRMQKHLLEYFADELNLPAQSGLPALTLPCPDRPDGLPERYVTFQARTGWSRYKEWPAERWCEVMAALPHIPFVQIGKQHDPRIAGAIHDYMGRTLRDATALFANASMHVGVDSFANHLSNFYWTRGRRARRVRAVIVWGSTQASAAGYPSNVNLSLGLDCQPCFRENPEISSARTDACPNEHACMRGISVQAVIDAVEALWQETTEPLETTCPG
jgi:ADP-heptose:LPS heptosyltransferase/glycosyltransferase involved in cell wall biosynthesis